MTTEGGPSGGTGRGRGTVGTPAWASRQLPVSAVARSRLLDRLDRLDPVAVVRAVHGFGRTVLAEQWAARQRSTGRPVAWTSGPWPSDGHRGPWTAVRDALTAALRAAGSDVPDAPDPAQLAAAVDAAGSPVVLVIDDADQLDAPADLQAVADLLTASHGLRLLLVTGARYPLRPSGAWHPVLEATRRPLSVVTLTARDLAFTPDELRAAAATWGHVVDDTRLRQVVDLVQGWPTLARAVLDDTGPGDARPATSAAFAYARDVMLPGVGDTVLLRAAMLVAAAGDPTPATTRLVLDAAGRSRSADDELDVLLRLEAVGMVVRRRTDAGPSRWHVPGLLREVLVRELERRDPELSARVHRVLAVAALTTHPPDPGAAVEHAARAHDWTLLETCWVDFGTYLVATAGAAVDAAYAPLPDAVTETSTVLALARAVARRGEDERDDPRALVLRLMTELGTLALDGSWRSRTPAGRWTGAASALVAARSRGDIPRAMVVVRDTEIAAARAGVAGGTSTRAYWWFLLQGGRTALLDGDLGTALELPMRAYELADPSRAPDVRAAAAGHVALVHALDGVLSDAERWLVRHAEALDPAWEIRLRDSAGDVAEAMVATDHLDLPAADAALSRLTLAVHAPDVTWPFVMRARVRRAVLFGEPETGLAELEQIERTHHVWLAQAGLVHRIVARLRAELLLALGEYHRVGDLLVGQDPTGLWSDVPRARWHLLTGDPHAALRSAVLGGRRRRVNLADRTDLLVLESWAALESGQTSLAVRAFRAARRVAGEQGALRSFAHLPGAVRDALVLESGVPFDDHELARLATTGQVVPAAGRLVPLTPRERTVLTLLDEHGTTREVADALTVSVNTVRKQVLSIYAKLGVHDREAALRRAHELGVLGPQGPGH